MTNSQIFAELRRRFAKEIATSIKQETRPTINSPLFNRESMDVKIDDIKDKIIRNLVSDKLAGFFHADYSG